MTTHDFSSGEPKKRKKNSEQTGPKQEINFEEIKLLAQPHAIEILEHFAPDGEQQGNEYVMLNPHRNEDANLGSFKFNVETGKWADFATDGEERCSGGDIVSLVAYLKRLKQHEAAQWLKGFVTERSANSTQGLARVPTAAQGKRKSEEQSEAILPVPPDAPAPPTKHPQLGVPDVIYRYSDKHDRTLCFVWRYEQRNEWDRKKFLPQTFRRFSDGTERWEWKGIAEARPLYNLRELALRPDSPVVIVEGEKAADAAKTLFPGRVVVASMNGSGAAKHTDWEPLFGRETLIWPDNDSSGETFANDVATMLSAQGPSMKVFRMPVPTVRPVIENGGPRLEPGFTAPKGWDAADAVAEGWTAGHLELFLESEPPSKIACEYEVDSFVVNDEGVHQRRENRDGDPFLVKVSSRIDVIAQSRRLTDPEWGYLLAIRNPDGETVEWCMPRSLMAKQTELLAELLKRGASLQRADAVCAYFLATDSAERILTVDQPGWHKDGSGKWAFVLPHQTFSEPGMGRILMEGIGAIKGFAANGSFIAWNDQIGVLCKGNSRLVFAVSAALVGPTLNLLDAEGGGFHLYGQSSIGKSTATSLAASVWGSTEFVEQWRTTDNALEAKAALHNDTLLVLDEVNQASSEVLGDVAYMLGNGTGKARADRSGEAKAIHRFRLVCLSNGEESLKLKLQSDDVNFMAGQEVRLPSIAADAGKGWGLFEDLHGHSNAQSLAMHLKEQVGKVYGSLGPAWIRYLLEASRTRKFRERVTASRSEFVTRFVPVGSSAQVIRVAQRFGLVAAVGEEAIRAGLLPWPEGEATAGAKTCFLSWIEDRGGVESQESQRYLAHMRRFIAQYGESRFSPWEQQNSDDPDTQSKTINRVGWRRLNDQDQFEYYIIPEAYRSEVCRGLDPKMMTRFLRQRELLKLGPGEKSTVNVRVPGYPAAKMYWIKASILDGGED